MSVQVKEKESARVGIMREKKREVWSVGFMNEGEM